MDKETKLEIVALQHEIDELTDEIDRLKKMIKQLLDQNNHHAMQIKEIEDDIEYLRFYINNNIH